MSSGDDLLDRLDNARTAHGGTPLDALWADAADRIRTLQASNLRLSGMFYDLTAQRDEALNQLDSSRHSVEVLEKRMAEFIAKTRFLERKAVESAKKA